MSGDRMSVVFFGTSVFAGPILSALVSAEDVRVLAVVTQCDRPSGRGLRLCSPPAKCIAEEMSLPCLQPTRLRSPSFQATIAELKPDFLVVAAYGRILPPDLLMLPRVAPVNVHASLLPQYRGAAPIQRAIMDGVTTTGVTTMWMNERLDEGDILLQRRVCVPPDANAADLTDLLAAEGAELALQTLRGMRDGQVSRIPQDHALATYAPPISQEDQMLRWSESAVRCHNRVRALAPRPAAYSCFRCRRLKVLETRVRAGKPDASPGTVVCVDRDTVVVQTGDGLLQLRQVQPENSRAMTAGEWARGARVRLGEGFDALA